MREYKLEFMDHGFYDRLVTCPQTEDCIIEMAKAIESL